MKDDEKLLPVLVVGAGPSGLMMAHELLRYGIPCTLIEKDFIRSPFTKAIGVQVRTLEIFLSLGLFDELDRYAHHVNKVKIFTQKKLRAKISTRVKISQLNSIAVIDQKHTEDTLLNRLNNNGMMIKRGFRLKSIKQFDDHVLATIVDDEGNKLREKYSYVIGADGAYSTVRKLMHDQFHGSSYDHAFILADVDCVHDEDQNSFMVFFSNNKFLAMIPMYGKDHYRLISISNNKPHIKEFIDLAKETVPFNVEIKNPTWVSKFFVQCRSANRYSHKRLFLVGDSAHIHSPAGAQGMNTGLQDAFNLGFKLAMVIKKIAKPEILATYHQERKPVGEFLLKYTDRLFKIMISDSVLSNMLRRVLLPLVGRSFYLRKKIFTTFSQTAIRYQSGCVCLRKKHLKLPGITVGMRVANIADLHKISAKLSFSLVIFFHQNISKEEENSIKNICQNFISSFASGLSFKFIYGEYNFLKEKNYFLIIRPDHHVFCLGLLDDLEHAKSELLKYLPSR